jgi:hypothetical protein
MAADLDRAVKIWHRTRDDDANIEAGLCLSVNYIGLLYIGNRCKFTAWEMFILELSDSERTRGSQR